MKFIILILAILLIFGIGLPVYCLESPADFNHDGVVDGQDLAVFSKEFGKHDPLSIFCAFAWDANKENNLAGYKIYYGTKSREYDKVVDIPDKNAITGKVTDLEPGVTYYFAAIAYNTDGLESDFSDEIVWTSKGDKKNDTDTSKQNSGQSEL